MSETISKRFSAAFDVTNQDHVLWLRAMHLATRMEQAPDTLMKNNPFGLTVKKNEVLDWVRSLTQVCLVVHSLTCVDDDRLT